MISRKITTLIRSNWKNTSVVKRAAFVFLFCTILQKTISIISTPIFTRLMNTEDYGQFIVYQSWLSLLSIFATFRLDYDVFNKGMSKYEDKNSYISTMQILTSIFTIMGMGCFLLFSKKLTTFVGLPFSIIIAIFIELFFMSPIAFWTLRERYEFRYKKLAIVTIMMSILNILLGVLFVVSAEEKGIARIMSCIVIQFVFGIFFFITNARKAKRIFVFEYARFALIFNLPLIPHYLSAYALNVVDKLMIQKLVGIAQAGIYGVVYSVGFVLTMITNTVNNALIPWQYQNLKSGNINIIKNTVNKIMVIVACFITGFVLFAPEFMRIMVADIYLEGVYVIPPVASSILFVFLYNLVCNAEFYYDKNKFTMIASGIAAILNIILNFFFIKRFGYIAAGYTTLFCYIIVAWLHVLYSNKIAEKESGNIIYDVNVLFIITVYMIGICVLATMLYRFTVLKYGIVILGIFVGILCRNKIFKIYMRQL